MYSWQGVEIFHLVSGGPLSRNSGWRVGWVWMAAKHVLVSCTFRVSLHQERVVYFKTSQERIRQIREMHTQ